MARDFLYEFRIGSDEWATYFDIRWKIAYEFVIVFRVVRRQGNKCFIYNLHFTL